MKALIDAGVVKFGRFVLSSGIESPFYVDLRRALGHPDLVKWVVSGYLSALSRLEFDVLLGVATGGIPYASILGYLLQKPFGYVRTGAKGYGTMQAVEGADVAGLAAVVVDDVLTTGNSLINAIRAVREAGGEVVGALVFLDREQCGSQNVRRETGVEVFSVYKMRELLEALKPYIGEGHYRAAVEYLAKWSC